MSPPASLIPAHWVVPIDGPPIPHGFVQTDPKTGLIVAVGRLADLAQADQQALTLHPHHTTVLTPGLVNTHTHLELTFNQADRALMPTTSGFADWLLAVVALTRDPTHSTPHATLARITQGIGQLRQSGCTTANDISSDGASLPLLVQHSCRGRVSLEFFHPALPPNQARLQAVLDLAEQYWPQQTPAVTLGLSPHSPYNVSPQAWQWMLSAWTKRFGTAPWVHTHVAESPDEQAWLLGQPNGLDTLHQRVLQQTFLPQAIGLSPVSYLHTNGLLNANTTIAHGVCTSTADRQTLQTVGVGLAHCPRSNHHLHGQTLLASHWQQYPAMGLGTDSSLSCPTLDIRDEARTAMALHGWDSAKALEVLTLGGATAMGLQHTIGSLTPNKAFDAVLWTLDGTEDDHATLSPQAVALSPSSVASRVWVGGRLIYTKPL
jgi:cytosine/adenosine deaminase-related metal-dependent hydrolase